MIILQYSFFILFILSGGSRSKEEFEHIWKWLRYSGWHGYTGLPSRGECVIVLWLYAAMFFKRQGWDDVWWLRMEWYICVLLLLLFFFLRGAQDTIYPILRWQWSSLLLCAPACARILNPGQTNSGWSCRRSPFCNQKTGIHAYGLHSCEPWNGKGLECYGYCEGGMLCCGFRGVVVCTHHKEQVLVVMVITLPHSCVWLFYLTIHSSFFFLPAFYCTIYLPTNTSAASATAAP